MVELDAKTYESLRRSSRLMLQNIGIDTAAMDVKILLCKAATCDASDLIARGNDPVPDPILRQFKIFLARRFSHEPIAHIIGVREFYGLSFEVSADVLIPRPETEGLVDQALAVMGNIPVPKILDIGTGSGAILIAVLANVPAARGLGVDISESALDIARRNSVQNGVGERAELIRSDLFDAAAGKFDIIVSNPPYITQKAMLDLDQTVKGFEPYLALCGGEDGLDFYRKIIKRAPDYLVPFGTLIFEIGYDQQQAVEGLMRGGGFNEVQTHFDLAEQARVVIGRMRG